MNKLVVVILIAIICSVTAFNAGIKTRVGTTGALKMALADYKEELASTAAKIAGAGK